MLKSQKAEQAALNNALWCDIICCTHGCPGEFHDMAWINHNQTPQFYPNVVTLSSREPSLFIQESVEEIIQGRRLTEWAVKDSFHTLNLDSMGFRILFEGQWLYKSLPAAKSAMTVPGVSWEKIATATALNEWETAWSGESGVRGIFLPELLSK